MRPTPANLNAYEKWSGSENQSTTWLGDVVDKVIKVELSEGNTMYEVVPLCEVTANSYGCDRLIPTGWIHCVVSRKRQLKSYSSN